MGGGPVGRRPDIGEDEQLLSTCPPHETPGEPAAALHDLAALGPAVDDDPRLLAIRARCLRLIGQTGRALDDVSAALDLDPEDDLRRWLTIMGAHYRFDTSGDGSGESEVVRAAMEGCLQLPTIAYGFRVLGEIAAAVDTERRLEEAARLFSVSMRMWEKAGSPTNLRHTRSALAADVLVPLGRHREAVELYDILLDDPQVSAVEAGWFRVLRGFALIFVGRPADAADDFAVAEEMAREPLNPLRISAVAWGRAMIAARSGDRALALHHANRAESLATVNDDRVAVPFLVDMSLELGALGDLELATEYLRRASLEGDAYLSLIDVADVVLRLRRGERVNDFSRVLRRTQPGLRPRVLITAAHAAASAGDAAEARSLLTGAQQALAGSGLVTLDAIGESRTHRELTAMLSAPGQHAGDLAQRTPLVRAS